MASSLLDRALVALASRGLTRLRPRQLKRHRVFPLCKAEAQIPLVVFADRAVPYRHASLVVKCHYTIEYVTPDAIGQHQNLMRKFAVEHRARQLTSGACHETVLTYIVRSNRGRGRLSNSMTIQQTSRDLSRPLRSPRGWRALHLRFQVAPNWRCRPTCADV